MIDLSKLNGWQRLWVVLSLIWLALVVFTLLIAGEKSWRAFLFLWAIPVGLLYVAGLAIKWILAGFFNKGK